MALLLLLALAVVRAEEKAGRTTSFTKDTVAKVCLELTKLCEMSVLCSDALTAALPEWGAGRDALKATWDSLGENTDALLFDQLSECYKTEMGKDTREIAKSIKCDWCGFIVEDI